MIIQNIVIIPSDTKKEKTIIYNSIIIHNHKINATLDITEQRIDR